MARRLYLSKEDQLKALAMIRLNEAERKHRETFKANDNLSRATSTICRILTDAHLASDLDANIYAPAECYGLIYKGVRKALIEALNYFGFESGRVFIEALEARISAKATTKRAYTN